MPPTSARIKLRPPVAIWFASGFIVLCSVALVVFDIALVMASLKVPNNPVYATHTQARGFIFIAALILLGACTLLSGVRKLLAKGQPTVLFVVLGIPLVIGCIGEIIDLFGTASKSSDLIGGGILLLFAIPIILLVFPSSRKWYGN